MAVEFKVGDVVLLESFPGSTRVPRVLVQSRNELVGEGLVLNPENAGESYSCFGLGCVVEVEGKEP